MSLLLTPSTPRLELIASTAETVSLALENVEVVAAALGVSAPSSWPPPLNATEASRELIRWAFSHRDLARVTSETLPDLIDSIRVMEKCGMRFVGDGAPEEGQRTVRYAVARAEFCP